MRIQRGASIVSQICTPRGAASAREEREYVSKCIISPRREEEERERERREEANREIDSERTKERGRERSRSPRTA